MNRSVRSAGTNWDKALIDAQVGGVAFVAGEGCCMDDRSGQEGGDCSQTSEGAHPERKGICIGSTAIKASRNSTEENKKESKGKQERPRTSSPEE